MTDRINGVFVTFEEDMREDDAEHVLNAIRMLRGVLDVRANVTTPSDVVARVRIRSVFVEQVFDLLKDLAAK